MMSIKHLIGDWIQRILNDDFDETSISELYIGYDNIVSNIDRAEILSYIDNNLKFYINHRVDFRDPLYYNHAEKFINDVIAITSKWGRQYYIFEVPIIALYMRLKINSDGINDNQHIYNLILNFLSGYTDNTSDDRCLLKIWHGLSELGYIQKSDSSHYVRSLKHRVFSAAFDFIRRSSYNNPDDSVKICDTHTELSKSKRDLVESIRYRAGVRIQSILDIDKENNLTVYEILEFIHCDKSNIDKRGYNSYNTAIGDKLSTDNDYTAIAAMLSTDNDYTAIEVIQSTYYMYYNLLLNILNDMNIDYWSDTYNKLESVLVTSTNILSKTKSFDMYLICIVIAEIMKRLSNFGDIDKLNKYFENIHFISYDDIIYTNNPVDLRLTLELVESELCRKSYIKHVNNLIRDDTKSSFLESSGVELSHLDGMAGFLTEGFQVIPHTECQGRNLAAISENNDILVSFMNMNNDVCMEACDIKTISQIARDNGDESAIMTNISVVGNVINELSHIKHNNQIMKAMNILKQSVSLDKLAIAKLHKNPMRYSTAQNNVRCECINNEIIIKL